MHLLLALRNGQIRHIIHIAVMHTFVFVQKVVRSQHNMHTMAHTSSRTQWRSVRVHYAVWIFTRFLFCMLLCVCFFQSMSPFIVVVVCSRLEKVHTTIRSYRLYLPHCVHIFGVFFSFVCFYFNLRWLEMYVCMADAEREKNTNIIMHAAMMMVEHCHCYCRMY